MIEIQDLYKYYGEKRAIGPVNATIESGEVIGLLELNGAGKTTTLRILACDLIPSGGTVLVDGHDVVDDSNTVKSLIGYLPEEDEIKRHQAVQEPKIRAEAAGPQEGIPG